MMTIFLRRAMQEDAEELWHLRNDPQTRLNSFHDEIIPWDSHKAWFEARLLDNRSIFYVACNDENQLVGQIRFECDLEGGCDVNLAIASNSRGKGYGKQMLSQAMKLLGEDKTIKVINAYVKFSNTASIALFEACGFECLGLISDKHCYKMCKRM